MSGSGSASVVILNRCGAPEWGRSTSPPPCRSTNSRIPRGSGTPFIPCSRLSPTCLGSTSAPTPRWRSPRGELWRRSARSRRGRLPSPSTGACSRSRNPTAGRFGRERCFPVSEAQDLRLPDPLPETAGGSVITVGTFDGVHRGHVAVLDAVRRAAQRRGARSIVVTFEPHPLRVVRPEKAPRLLTTAEEKHEQLERVGLDVIVHLPFTQALAQFTAREFVQEILVDRLRLEHLVIGHDHGLGRDRSGNETALREIGAELGYDVEVVEAVIVEGGPVSSTRIRGLLERGDVVEAATLLGRPYSIRGVVVEGER